MARKIKGITVFLSTRKQIGYDPFGKPIYEDVDIPIHNVLIAPTSTEDITNSLAIAGKKAVYTLAIPKGDTNKWQNQTVKFFGKTWRVFGNEMQGIEDLIPLDWNKKVMVERYE